MRNRIDREPMRDRLAVARCDAPCVLDMRGQVQTPPATPPRTRSWIDLLADEPRRMKVRPVAAPTMPAMPMVRREPFDGGLDPLLVQWASTRPCKGAGKGQARPEPADERDEPGLDDVGRYRQGNQPQAIVCLVALHNGGWQLGIEARHGGQVGKPICQRCRSLADLRAAARAFLSTVKGWGLRHVRLVASDCLAGSDALRLLVSIASAALIAPTTPANHRSMGVRPGQARKIHAVPLHARQAWPGSKNASAQHLGRSRSQKTILARLNASH